MSKNSALSEERKAQVVQEFVDMYIEKGGEYPTAREIKKNKYVAEWEVSVVKKLGLLEDWRVRRLAKEKTGINYPPMTKRHKERAIEASRNKSKDKEKAEQKEVITMAEVEKTVEKTAEEKPNIGAPESKPQEISTEKATPHDELKRVLHDFGEANLRWPTGKEIDDCRSKGIPGWYSSTEVQRRLGPKSSWKDKIFPEGLPDGFVAQNRGGHHNHEEPHTHKKLINKEIEHGDSEIKELEKRINWISKLFSDGHLDAVIETSNCFAMRSEASACYKGKYIRFIFEVQENDEK